MCSSSTTRHLLLILLLTVPAVTLPLAQGSVYYFPHVANGEIGGNRFCNTLYMLNYNNNWESAEITIDFFHDDGSPWVISMLGDQFNGVSSSFTGMLGDSSASYSVTDPYDHPLETGWMRITSSRPIWATSTYVFLDWDWVPLWEAGILPATASRYFDFRSPIAPNPLVGDNLNTALAIANPNAVQAQVTASLYKWNLVTTKTINVPPNGHFAQFLSELFEVSDDLDGESFWVDFSSNIPVAIVGLFSRENMSVFSSIPLEPSEKLIYNRIADIHGNQSLADARAIVPPVEITGNLIANYDYFKLDLIQGEDVNILALSSQLGSSLNPTIALYDRFGAQVAFNDDMSDNCSDAFISYRATSSGSYIIRIGYAAGSSFGYSSFYRLIVSIP